MSTTPRTDNYRSQGREWLPLGIFEDAERKNTKYLDAIKMAEAMICAQEDALRSIGADEPCAESAILMLRDILSNVQGEAQPPAKNL